MTYTYQIYNWVSMSVHRLEGKFKIHAQKQVSASVSGPMLCFWSSLGKSDFWRSRKGIFAGLTLLEEIRHTKISSPTSRSTNGPIKTPQIFLQSPCCISIRHTTLMRKFTRLMSAMSFFGFYQSNLTFNDIISQFWFLHGVTKCN